MSTAALSKKEEDFMRDPISSGSLDTVYYELVEAACRDKSTDMFFSQEARVQRQAKRICRTCPERERCLAMALANSEAAGVWGGVVFRKGHPDRHDMKYWEKHEVQKMIAGAAPQTEQLASPSSPPKEKRKKSVGPEFTNREKGTKSAKLKKNKKKNGRSHDEGFSRYPVPPAGVVSGTPNATKKVFKKTNDGKKKTKK